jgi:hypothetical protein
MAKPAQIVRFAGRLALLGVVSSVLAIVAMQFEGIVTKNVALAHELSVSRADVEAIRAGTRERRQTIVRLSDPRGAIPEIHDKLRLVGPHEEIIYLSGAGQQSPKPDDWNAGR